MPSFVEEKGFTVECNKEDISQYLASVAANPKLSFIEYIKDKIEIEKTQGIDLIIKDLDLRDINLSKGIFSTKDSDDCYSTITFQNVNFPIEEDNLSESVFLGTTFQETNFIGVPISKLIINEDTKFVQCNLSQEQRKHITAVQEDLQAHREDSITKTTADRLKKDVLAEAQSLIEQSWGQFGKSFFKKDAATLMRESVAKLFSNALGSSNTFETFLPHRDEQELASMKAALKTFSETIKEQFDTITKDKKNIQEKEKAIIGSTAAMALMRELNAFKKAIAEKDTSGLLNATKPLVKKPVITGITQSAISALGPYIGADLSGSRSAWPNISKDRIAERKRNLELKKEGLEILQTISRTAGGAGILASAYQRGVSGAIGATISAIVAGTGEVTVANIMSELKINTPENIHISYEKFNNQFGDKLIEIAVAKKALGDSLKFMTSNEATQMLLSLMLAKTNSPSYLSGAQGIMTIVSRIIAGQNIRSVYAFIQNQKSIDPRKRLSPGSEEFSLKLNKKMIDVSRFFMYATFAATLTAAILLTAVIAGPFIPAIATVSTLSLATIGVITSTAISYVGYKIHTSIKPASPFQTKEKTQPTIAPAHDQPQPGTSKNKEKAQAPGVTKEEKRGTPAHSEEKHASNSVAPEEEKDVFHDAETHDWHEGSHEPKQKAIETPDIVRNPSRKTYVKRLQEQKNGSLKPGRSKSRH